MANYILKELPEEMTDGKKVVFPKMQNCTLLDHKKVVHNMHMFTGPINDGLIYTVLGALVETMACWMPKGHSIKIDGLGVFYVSLGFDTSTPSEKEIAQNDLRYDKPQLEYRHVCVKGINFRPDPDLLREMNDNNTFKCVEVDVEVEKCKYSREERLAIAKEIIDRYGYLTLKEYARATGQCRSAASKDLGLFSSEVKYGITTRGRHSHKVWVAADWE